MTISDKINATLSILSFILSAISVISVVLDLRQNKKMMENSTRPYVIVHSNITYFQDLKYYLVIKNYGQTGAVIKDFKCSVDLLKYYYLDKRRVFDHIAGTFIAPQQSFVACIDSKKLIYDNIDKFEFWIKYSDGRKEYEENYTINVLADADNVKSRASTTGDNTKIISYVLQDMAEKLL